MEGAVGRGWDEAPAEHRAPGPSLPPESPREPGLLQKGPRAQDQGGCLPQQHGRAGSGDTGRGLGAWCAEPSPALCTQAPPRAPGAFSTWTQSTLPPPAGKVTVHPPPLSQRMKQALESETGHLVTLQWGFKPPTIRALSPIHIPQLLAQTATSQRPLRVPTKQLLCNPSLDPAPLPSIAPTLWGSPPAAAGGHQAQPLQASTHSHASDQQGDFFREENQENVAAAPGMWLQAGRAAQPGPSSSECPQSTLRFQLFLAPSPGSTPGQSPAYGLGCPGPGEMLGRKKNKLEEDKEAQALQPSQLGTDVGMRAEVTIGRGADALHTGAEGAPPSALRPGLAALSDPANPSPTKPGGPGYSKFPGHSKGSVERLVQADRQQRHPQRWLPAPARAGASQASMSTGRVRQPAPWCRPAFQHPETRLSEPSFPAS